MPYVHLFFCAVYIGRAIVIVCGRRPWIITSGRLGAPPFIAIENVVTWNGRKISCVYLLLFLIWGLKRVP